MEEKAVLVVPGVYDGFSARIALQVGFDCLYMVRTTLSLLRRTLNTPDPQSLTR